MGSSYDTEKHKIDFETYESITRICTVNSFEQAKILVSKLKNEGFGVVELCGAFGEEKAKELMTITNNEIGIAYVVNSESQNKLFQKFFGQ